MAWAGGLPRPSGVSSKSGNLSEPRHAHLQIWAAQDCFSRGGPSAWQARSENAGLLPLLWTWRPRRAPRGWPWVPPSWEERPWMPTCGRAHLLPLQMEFISVHCSSARRPKIHPPESMETSPEVVKELVRGRPPWENTLLCLREQRIAPRETSGGLGKGVMGPARQEYTRDVLKHGAQPAHSPPGWEDTVIRRVPFSNSSETHPDSGPSCWGVWGLHEEQSQGSPTGPPPGVDPGVSPGSWVL